MRLTLDHVRAFATIQPSTNTKSETKIKSATTWLSDVMMHMDTPIQLDFVHDIVRMSANRTWLESLVPVLAANVYIMGFMHDVDCLDQTSEHHPWITSLGFNTHTSGYPALSSLRKDVLTRKVEHPSWLSESEESIKLMTDIRELSYSPAPLASALLLSNPSVLIRRITATLLEQAIQDYFLIYKPNVLDTDMRVFLSKYGEEIIYRAYGSIGVKRPEAMQPISSTNPGGFSGPLYFHSSIEQTEAERIKRVKAVMPYVESDIHIVKSALKVLDPKPQPEEYRRGSHTPSIPGYNHAKPWLSKKSRKY